MAGGSAPGPQYYRHECLVSVPGTRHPPYCTCRLWWLILVLSAAALAQDNPQEVEIIKQINKVNDDGSYTFGYEAADGSFKIETRDVMGNVKGMFGFVDETGELKRVSYTANNGTGFRTVEGEEGERPEEGTRRPLVVLPRHPLDPTRAPVIQHIPRRLGVATAATTSTSTTPSYGEYLKGRRTHIVLPNRGGDVTTTPKSPQVKEEPETDEPTQIPLRRLIVTKRPVTGKGGNNLRRQLGGEPDSGDVSDVYSGGASSPRYVPAQSVRSPQSSLLANLPPHVATAIRQQQIARAAAALRPYPPGVESPRGNVIDEQEYPPVRGARTNLPPVRGLYRPSDLDGPIDIPFPMANLRSLRDELMEYIMQYLQYRLSGGAPIPFSPYQSSPYQNPNFNPNFPYQPPINYQGANPNFYNPYYYPNQPFPRVPYQPPFGPAGYPPVGYPPVGYPPVSGYPQPLPFSSPNKQQASPQYVPSQRSVSYDPESQRAEAEGRGTSDQTTYSLPPADVLRMMLSRGLVTAQTSTSTTTTARPLLPTPVPGPVRNVQIIGAASSVSSTTVLPPAPVEEMHMQA